MTEAAFVATRNAEIFHREDHHACHEVLVAVAIVLVDAVPVEQAHVVAYQRMAVGHLEPFAIELEAHLASAGADAGQVVGAHAGKALDHQ